MDVETQQWKHTNSFLLFLFGEQGMLIPYNSYGRNLGFFHCILLNELSRGDKKFILKKNQTILSPDNETIHIFFFSLSDHYIASYVNPSYDFPY